MQHFWRAFAPAVALLIANLSMTVSANATIIRFDYFAEVTNCPFGAPDGPCGTADTPGPIVVGSTIIGSLGIDETAVAAGAASAADVADFFFDVAGIFALSPAGGQSVGADTLLLFDAAGDFIGGLFTLFLPNLAGPGIDGLLLNEFGDDGSGEWQIIIPAFGDALVNGGVAQLTRSVPEPSTLALLTLGLAGVGLAGRKRSRV